MIPKFCTKCGEKLENKTVTESEGFDAYTGQHIERVRHYLMCPKRVVGVTHSPHDFYELLPDGSIKGC